MSIKVYPYGFCSSDFVVQRFCSILASSMSLLMISSSSHRASSLGLLHPKPLEILHALLELQNRCNCVSCSLVIGLESHLLGPHAL